MRIAWFRAGSFTPVVAVSAPAVVRTLDADHHVDIITAAEAHNFVVAQAQQRYDLCVYELRNTPRSEFIWAYLYHYPGVLLLDDRTLHDSRVRALERHRRLGDYEAEFQFDHGHPSRAGTGTFPRGTWPMLRAPVIASRLTVVHDHCFRDTLEATHPEARIRVVPVWAPGPADDPPLADPGAVTSPCRVEVWGTSRKTTAERLIARARNAGADVALVEPETVGPDAVDLVHARPPEPQADVVVILDAPGETAGLSRAVAAMAIGQAVILVERESSAAWPALDPQRWRPRDHATSEPAIVVSIDPRDEEHSLVLALKGLSRAPEQRRALGRAARSWWMAHATPGHAARAWEKVLSEAGACQASARPADWPQHLRDWRQHASAITSDLGFTFSL